jgi:SAM-dependent methyltransferase
MNADESGYVTDIPYPAGYYREQAPQHLNLACLLAGYRGIDCSQKLTYLELGCGYGFGATALAASNPHWTVIGIDLMPGHIRAAQELADAAGLSNIRFVEGDLATMAEEASGKTLPPADVISLHGLWTWVPGFVQQGVVRLIDAKLRPGGIVQVSSNSLPGWQSAMGLQHVIREFGLRSAGSSTDQALTGLRSVFEMIGAGAMHLSAQPFVQAMLHALKTSEVDYLSHEYMNGSWAPVFHSDLCRDLALAGLDWVGSANLMENLPELTLTDAQRRIYDAAPDAILKELVKDMCLFRGFRNDVFVRGATRLSPAERSTALRDVLLFARQPAQAFSRDVFIPRPAVPRVPVRLPDDLYDHALALLDTGPQPAGKLFNAAHQPGAMLTGDDPIAELIAILAGTNHAIPITASPIPVNGSAHRFNSLSAERLIRSKRADAGSALATTGMGAPLPCTVLEGFAWSQMQSPLANEQGGLNPTSNETSSFAELPEVWKAMMPIWSLAGLRT